MKYFLDTEFLEGPQNPKWLILKSRLGRLMIGKPKPTIDLISIGIVAEDEREYYAISKDFNFKEAWNRYDFLFEAGGVQFHPAKKVYWLRENVLKPIWRELIVLETDYLVKQKRMIGYAKDLNMNFNFKNFKYLVNKYGKTNKEIADEVKSFCIFYPRYNDKTEITTHFQDSNIEFYAYYADYDWVVFCWLFGKMMDLPSGFPNYCKDLKQMLDDKVMLFWKLERKRELFLGKDPKYKSIDEAVSAFKTRENYPKQDLSKSHNAIEDARWNKQLYDFLNKL